MTGIGSQQPGVHHHDPYEGLRKSEIDFLERLKAWILNTYGENTELPLKLEITNGVCRDRLTLSPDEVFCLKKKPKGNGKRKVEVHIMSENEAKQCAVDPYFPPPDWPDHESGSASKQSSASYAPSSSKVKSANPPTEPAVDPCCWWEWNGSDWVCVAYGN